MTKQIRIENADVSTHKAQVWVERQQADGTWVRDATPLPLDYPTALQSGWIHRTQRLVIEEVPE